MDLDWTFHVGHISGRIGFELDLGLFKYPMQVRYFFVSQIEEAVTRMMSMETHFGAARPFAATNSHFEWHFATDAKLELALCEVCARNSRKKGVVSSNMILTLAHGMNLTTVKH